MDCQVERHLLLFKSTFKRFESNIRAVYREVSIGDLTALKWFSCFKERNFALNDTLCSGRPTDFDEERLSGGTDKVLFILNCS